MTPKPHVSGPPHPSVVAPVLAGGALAIQVVVLLVLAVQSAPYLHSKAFRDPLVSLLLLNSPVLIPTLLLSWSAYFSRRSAWAAGVALAGSLTVATIWALLWGVGEMSAQLQWPGAHQPAWDGGSHGMLYLLLSGLALAWSITLIFVGLCTLVALADRPRGNERRR